MRYFRSKLKEIVTQKKGRVTHEQISAITGVRRATITLWMNNRTFRRLDMSILDPIATWLECDPEDLYEIVEIDDSGETS